MTIHRIDADEWADVQDHLVVNLQKYSREFSHNPSEAVKFANGLPGLLRLIKTSGESEAQDRCHRMPFCFLDRVQRLTDVARRLKGNLKNDAIDDNEAAAILSMLYIHANKLAITVDARIQGQSTQFIGRQMARMYGSPRGSQRDSETFIAWDWLSNHALRCRCRTCLADASEA